MSIKKILVAVVAAVEEIINEVEFELEHNEECFKLHDLLSANLGDIEGDEFHSLCQVIDRLEIYLDDYFYKNVEEREDFGEEVPDNDYCKKIIRFIESEYYIDIMDTIDLPTYQSLKAEQLDLGYYTDVFAYLLANENKEIPKIVEELYWFMKKYNFNHDYGIYYANASIILDSNGNTDCSNEKPNFSYADGDISMRFENGLNSILNSASDHNEALEDFRNIFSAHGYYYELGNSWNLSAYPIHKKSFLEETKDYSILKSSVSAENLEYFNDVINLYEGSKISVENDNLIYLDHDIKLKHENLAIRIIAWYEGMIKTEEFIKEIITK